MSEPCILFAGGGSGGHVFPMLAVAEELTRLEPHARVIFVGTARGQEARLVPERGYTLELVEVSPIRGGGLTGAMRGVRSAALSLPSAVSLVRKHRPKLVFSIGGYAAGPVALAARSLGVPLAVLEPNAEIGLSNRLIAPLAQRAYIAFPRTRRWFSSSVVRETGVPIRSGFEPAEFPAGSPQVLVLGGSQGAKSLNERVPQALARLQSRPQVIHQCGSAHAEATRELYASVGLSERVRVLPFIADMPRALAEAQLVIGRAGAGAVSEICAVGRGSLLIPYPFAGDHQRFNTQAMVECGASVVLSDVDATPERLSQELEGLLRSPLRLQNMARAARGLGRPHAAAEIARDLLSLAGSSTASSQPSGEVV
ncbi:MAG TPA: undecaprenyldiphospho-muramoylpentapeptide beta-N-acetylglucosaminyltransferase [Polyangiaceae bacterium]|nr:undecaprenyldiphospho-muramoylpentapeptide beta-N-acetylglucosaminyltransferase [Polyangiaceae bacterium]